MPLLSSVSFFFSQLRGVLHARHCRCGKSMCIYGNSCIAAEGIFLRKSVTAVVAFRLDDTDVVSDQLLTTCEYTARA